MKCTVILDFFGLNIVGNVGDNVSSLHKSTTYSYHKVLLVVFLDIFDLRSPEIHPKD